MLEEELNLFRQVRTRTLSLVSGLTQPQLDYRSGQDRWSVGEVLDHLLLTERFFRGEMRELIARARAGLPPVLYRSLLEFNISPAFIPRPLLPYLEMPLRFIARFIPRSLRDVLIRSRLFPARHPDIAAPRWGRNIAEICGELSSSMSETEALLWASSDLNIAAMRHAHPLLGTNTVPELLRILALHEQRHQAQILDLLRSMPIAPVTDRPCRGSPIG